MYIVSEYLSGTDIYETKPGDKVMFIAEEKCGGELMNVCVKKANGKYETIFTMVCMKDANITVERYLKALENNDRVFYISRVYFEVGNAT